MPAREDRAAEYRDSPLMYHRIRYRRELVVRIDGRYGTYTTRASLPGPDASCTCPSDEAPCKHIRALRRTWRTSPESFFDLEQFLAGLGQGPKAALMAALATAILVAPACLGALGVPGFRADSEAESPEDREELAGPESLRPVAGALRLTPLQARYLTFIHSYRTLHRRAPAEADLQRYFRVSPPSVHQMLVRLEARGLIAREPGKARSIRVLVPPDQLPELR